jgi:MoxR-like ATPase
LGLVLPIYGADIVQNLPQSIDATTALLASEGYVADRALSTLTFLSLTLNRPIFLEGEAGVGKTELAKVIAQGLGRDLIRLQCYEGLDASSSVYEWNFASQMLAMRNGAEQGDLYSEKYLIKRALLQAVEPHASGAPVLLIDEIDRTDAPFEAFLLEALSDFQVTVPELGVIKAPEPPIVILTSNRTREVHDALKRRCLYHWVDYPEFRARDGNPACPAARGERSSQPRGGLFHPKASGRRAVQATWPGGDLGLGQMPCGTGCCGSITRCDHRYHRCGFEIPR